MEFEKASDSWNYTENHPTTDLAILQALALRNRIVLRFFSGNSSYIAYTLREIACQYRTAHVAGQNCSYRLVAGEQQCLLIRFSQRISSRGEADGRGFMKRDRGPCM